MAHCKAEEVARRQALHALERLLVAESYAYSDTRSEGLADDLRDIINELRRALDLHVGPPRRTTGHQEPAVRIAN